VDGYKYSISKGEQIEEEEEEEEFKKGFFAFKPNNK
jgi:hypothetical protein